MHKKDGATSIEDFRPTSLVGSIYKIISKMLSNRLKKVLYVSSFQNVVFVEGRQIFNVALMTNEVFDSRKKKSTQVFCVSWTLRKLMIT